MTTKPNLNILNEMAPDIFSGLNAVKLRTVKKGQEFCRKPTSEKYYVRAHYNRKDEFGPATFTCIDGDDIGRYIELKPDTIVYVEG